MALLERHGVGNGKYKVGGSFPNTVLTDDVTRGRGAVLFSYTESETAKILQSIELDKEGSFYVGSRLGVNNLTKYDKDGNLIWENNDGTNIEFIKYDKYTDTVWAFADSYGVRQYSTSGTLLMEIPYSVSTFIGMDFSEDYIVLSNFGSATATNVNSVTMYDRNGALVRNFTNQAVKNIAIFDDHLYIYDLSRLNKYTLAGTPVWSFLGINNNSNATKVSMVKDFFGNIYLMHIVSANPVGVNMYYINDTDGTQILRSTKNAATVTPGVNDDYPNFTVAFLFNDGKSNPLIFSYENSNSLIRYMNSSLKIISRRQLSNPSSTLATGYSIASYNDSGLLAYVSNKNFYLVDPKEYYIITS